ncbi:ATP-binding protein [Streptomyces sp. 8N706]|uniref:ATP-binding protein n=1 Tax=Streptomyces sp. 8N706 TaxID=3457416 RepID=UPI003FD3CCA3
MNSTKSTTRLSVPAPTVVRGENAADLHRARRAARVFADSLTPPPDPGAADTLVLVVSELITNALRHGGGRYTLELSAGHDTLNVAVSDPSPAPPRDRTPDLNGGGGFGWPMVRRLARTLTVTPGPGRGKTIHAQLPR